MWYIKFLIWFFLLGCFSHSFSYDASDIESADFLAQKGIIENWASSHENYKLDDTITRREMLKVMLLLSEKQVINSCTGLFQDLWSQDWGCKYAETAVKEWFITQNSYFRPDDSITQIEALKMIMQAQSIEKDAGKSDWREGYVSKAGELGLIRDIYFNYDTIALRKNIFEVGRNSLAFVSEILDEIWDPLFLTVPYKVINWVDPNLLSLDLRYFSDTQNKKPVVIYVHGGGWAIGDKSYQLENKIPYFESLGYIFVSVNYRLSPNPESDNPNRVMYPIHNEDVASSLAWVVKNIDQYGWDASKIALMGHSAWGHLVALTATNETFLEAEGINLENLKGVAIIDTEGYDIQKKVVEEENYIYVNAFGETQANLLDASPVYNLSKEKSYPPFFIVKRSSGSEGEIEETFIRSLEIYNKDVTVVDGSMYTHKEVNGVIGSPDDTFITPPLTEFFQSIFSE